MLSDGFLISHPLYFFLMREKKERKTGRTESDMFSFILVGAEMIS